MEPTKMSSTTNRKLVFKFLFKIGLVFQFWSEVKYEA